ncbi:MULTISPECIES: thioesterase family protein [unclassified Micromonospora]|uniref:thioesterase family protein n=1 Tax=unclassified Micromonospora TaxID=2617518 RepID=UPI0010334F96|nr:thioesterase family protein [Verrucosispora sp. SN26_14.1]TBL36914.1 thioesterase family protein [Verrucosispora sp. SN26_14.1]
MGSPVFAQRWLGMQGIFGGFVLGRIVDAADSVDGFAPQAVTMHFVAGVRPGPVQVTTETLHRGRATASVRITLSQQDRARVHAMASLVPVGQRFRWRRREDPAAWGDPETLPAYVPRHRPLAYSAQLDVRTGSAASLADGTSAWVRIAPEAELGEALGPHAVASIFLDALPPGLFTLAPPPHFVPSVDFTVHFAPDVGDVAGAWHHVVNRTVWSTEDFCVDESTLHDRAGNPIAQLRQGRAIQWHDQTRTPATAGPGAG